mmetsp:Transcript_80001/g.226376  ORF Transcript_80001/g.226376 Transcript_80001/m.226376 type:complete len:344 (+) Transcript_80001:1552-2583(+)
MQVGRTPPRSSGAMLRIWRAGSCGLTLQFITSTWPTPSSSHLATLWPLRPRWATSILTSSTWARTISCRTSTERLWRREPWGVPRPLPAARRQLRSAAARKNAWNALNWARACRVLGIAGPLSASLAASPSSAWSSTSAARDALSSCRSRASILQSNTSFRCKVTCILSSRSFACRAASGPSRSDAAISARQRPMYSSRSRAFRRSSPSSKLDLGMPQASRTPWSAWRHQARTSSCRASASAAPGPRRPSGSAGRVRKSWSPRKKSRAWPRSWFMLRSCSESTATSSGSKMTSTSLSGALWHLVASHWRFTVMWALKLAGNTMYWWKSRRSRKQGPTRYFRRL